MLVLVIRNLQISSNHLFPIQNYDNIIDHVPYAVYYNSMAYLFYNWEFVSLNPLHLLHPLLPFSGSHCLFSEVANLNEADLPLIQFCHTVSSPHSEIIKQSLSFVVLLPLCSLSTDHQDSSYSQLSY